MIRTMWLAGVAVFAVFVAAAVTHAAPVKYVLQTPGVV